MNFGSRVVKIAFKDIVEHNPDELILMYDIKDWLGKTLLRQGIRSIQNPDDLISAYIGSFSWTILALIIVMAEAMHLFTATKRYYVRAFCLAATLAFRCVTDVNFNSCLQLFSPLGEWWGFVILGAAVFLLLTMKRFYAQNWFWTTFKWFWFIIFYAIGFSILFALGLLVVFTFF
ncbi:MAG: hypothetical protein IPO07_06905 [Haliscomenobacter sp.]|nr:hypothetical protein [Haliscomenobacter sp.]MBK9488532.1 hypothetical protein [Haliscomenobacter sp.]